MYRVMKSGSKLYAIETDLDDEEEIENIKQFVAEANTVLLTDDLEDVKSIYGYEYEIEIVEQD